MTIRQAIGIRSASSGLSRVGKSKDGSIFSAIFDCIGRAENGIMGPMSIDPSQIHLTPDQQAYIARQAELQSKPWPELLEQFVPAAIGNSLTSETAYDAAKRLGLIGGVRSGHTDLATNPEHMEGFGQ